MRAFFALTAAVLFATCASAQDIADTFEQLHGTLKAGDAIVLMSTAGTTVRGRVIDLSSSSLALAVDGQRREYGQAEVLKITQTRHGNAGKGLAIGAGVGAGLGLLGVAASGGSDCGQCLTAYVMTFTGIGAGLGAAIAVSSWSDHLLFLKTGSRASVAVAPAVGATTKGVSLSVRW